MTMAEGGALTTLEEMIWNIALWEFVAGAMDGSESRPAPQQFVAPLKKDMRRDFWCERVWRVRIR